VSRKSLLSSIMPAEAAQSVHNFFPPPRRRRPEHFEAVGESAGCNRIAIWDERVASETFFGKADRADPASVESRMNAVDAISVRSKDEQWQWDARTRLARYPRQRERKKERERERERGRERESERDDGCEASRQSGLFSR